MSILLINSHQQSSSYPDGTTSVSFEYLGHKTYSAKKVEKLYGVWVSEPICLISSLFIKWNDLTASMQKFSGTDVWIYIRAASTTTLLPSQKWEGPFLNEVNDISGVSAEACFQVMVIIKNDGTARAIGYDGNEVGLTPIIDSLNLSYLSAADSVKFFTKAFDLGFYPKHILLTYDGEVSDDAVVRFAVSGFDTTDTDYYQYITPDKIEELTDLSLLSDKLKVMIEMISDSTVSTKIHEFALMFSGDQQDRLNRGPDSKYEESSSSSSSSSSSFGYSTSSSSSSSLSSSSSSSSEWIPIIALRGNGTDDYVDTNFIPDCDTEVRILARLVSITGTYYLNGSVDNTGGGLYHTFGATGGKFTSLYPNGTGASPSSKSQDADWHFFIHIPNYTFADEGLWVDGVKVCVGGACGALTSVYNYTLYDVNFANSNLEIRSWEIARIQFIDKGTDTVVADLQAQADGTFYDVVNDTTHNTEGAGALSVIDISSETLPPQSWE